MKKRAMAAIFLALVMSLGCLTGCAQSTAAPKGTELAAGGVLVLQVNPEIAVEYDETGVVTGIIARNEDALAIVDSCSGLIGRQTRDAVTALVRAIGEAGYFVEELEGGQRRITLEIESGSVLPHDDFLDEVAAAVEAFVNANSWDVPTETAPKKERAVIDYDRSDDNKPASRRTDYGKSDYGKSDYGKSDYGTTDYGTTDYGTTDYGTTDYGTTDYGTTDYGTTDYGTTDYGTTDYGTTDYGNSDYGNSDYGDSDYGDSDYGDSDYDD